MSVADLPRRHAAAWRQATCHPFLKAVHDGSLPAQAFDRWLEQDAHFVTALLRFQARLLARAPRSVQKVLADGSVALVAELRWFDDQAAARGLALDAVPLPETMAYVDLLQRLDAGDVGSALTALWALERSYLDAWTLAAPGAPQFQIFVEHWTTPEFRRYVAELEAAATAVHFQDADGVFQEIVAAEVRFWDMAVATS